MKEMSIFAERLYELMSEYKLNSVKLEKICGCKNQSVSSWIAYGIYPKLKNLIRLSDYFNCSIDYILGLTDKREANRSPKPSNFSERIEFLLKRENLTRYKVAKACDFDRANFSKWEKGITPSTEIIVKLSEYFNCTVEFLYGLSDEIYKD